MDRVRKGDFVVPKPDFAQAKRVFQDRSKRSQQQDRVTRAPITEDVGFYKAVRGRGVDYPGVDTPTDDPRNSLWDCSLPPESSSDMAVDPVDETPHEQLAFGLRETEGQGRHLIDLLRGEFE